MEQINLQAIPNQSMSFQLDGNIYNFSVRVGGDFMFVDIVRNSVSIVLGMRAVDGTPLIPYRYLQDGNFIFLTKNDEYPFYTEFGSSQLLIYASQAELDSIFAGTFRVRLSYS